jgi:hypothetical protein
MRFGAEALHTAMTVRLMRTRAEKSAQSVSYAVDSMTPQQRRYFSARFAAETTHTEAEMAQLWAVYQDIWTPELTELGLRTLGRKDSE